MIFTLLADGPSDRALLPILRWALGEHGVSTTDVQLADFRLHPKPPKTLLQRLEATIELFPCDLLFVHRDSEAQSPEARVEEIREAIASLSAGTIPPYVCVVPVRMSEAWLVMDAVAIATAAGRPSMREEVSRRLPSPLAAEKLPDPKTWLHQLLRDTSGLTGRHLERFDPRERLRRIAELTVDWSPLRKLSAFQRFEAELVAALVHLE